MRGRGSVSTCKNNESHNMRIDYPAFHAEYWIYLLAAFVIVGVGTLLYTVDGPITFSSWFGSV
jgi:hypothetical protein